MFNLIVKVSSGLSWFTGVLSWWRPLKSLSSSDTASKDNNHRDTLLDTSLLKIAHERRKSNISVGGGKYVGSFIYDIPFLCVLVYYWKQSKILQSLVSSPDS